MSRTKESGDTITAKGQRERLYELMRERAEKAEAERDALREAAQALVTARAEGARIEPWGALIAALEHRP